MNALEKVKVAEGWIKKLEPRYVDLLGRDSARFVRLAMQAVRTTPKLAECSLPSVLGAVMECAQLRLEPSVNGDCWILPYAGVAKLIIGYRGMAKLAYRSSLVASVNAAVVYEGDEFRYSLGTEAGIHHIPSGQTDPNRITHAYAVIRTTLGGVVFRVLTRAEIDEARKRSPSGTQPGGPWAQHYAEMAMKTAVRRVSKLGPCDADMARAIDLDEAGESGRPQSLEMSLPEDFIDAESSEPEPNLGARLEAQSAREGGGA